MKPRTTGSTDAAAARWTDRHALAGLAVVTAAATGLLAASDPALTAGAVLLAVVAAAVVPLGFDGFVGLLVGLLAAAGLAVVKQLTGSWTPESFWRSLLTTLLLLLLGWAAGRLGKRLTVAPGGGGAASQEEVAAFGSLGLVQEAAAVARLEEEVARADRHGRPLSVLLLRTSVPAGSGMDDDSTAAAQRVVARHLEATLRRTDVPFALAGDLVGAILPETPNEGGWEVAGSVLERAADATFTDREQRSRLRLADHADLSAGIASLPEDGRDASVLLASALRSMDAVEEP